MRVQILPRLLMETIAKEIVRVMGIAINVPYNYNGEKYLSAECAVEKILENRQYMSKTIDQMTIQELEAALEKKKNEEQNIIIQEGFLKCDLIDLPDFQDLFRNDKLMKIHALTTREQLNQVIEKLKKLVTIMLPAGTRFVQYSDGFWFDDVNYGMEYLDNSWAKEYLINIKKVEK